MQIPAILYRLAVACWLGGATLFTFVLTPSIFKAYNRDMAGGIVGVLFPGYFKWGLACGVVALVALFFSAAKQQDRGRRHHRPDAGHYRGAGLGD